MITTTVYTEDYTSFKEVKTTAHKKVNEVIFYKLNSLLEFPDELIDGWDKMTKEEQEKVYSLVQKKVNRFRPKKNN